ncbi:carboxyl-terminal-processing peptidase 1, chloroplastic isoform X3 [Juglans microcarpa x Juglans regia]|uniref:carboxyl-terminal-processing peptidase 1, chloroplastic isoform X3 n=1 Tax=Juglans microcarpa x Juglans regia TaxID=2249226 RepID=UPI001B7E8BF3|nr:carboxyl-terminal-processing peptidase 1, chloroplastic isoform X3 [Juglans microcarpa x Juglans regia]
MRVSALSSSLPTIPPSPSETRKPQILCNNLTTTHGISADWAKKSLIGALSGALSFGILFSSPCSIAFQSPTVQSPPPPPPSSSSLSTKHDSSSELCREDERLVKAETGPEVVTNEGIVEEAWEIVNDSFLDTGRHRWSPQTWKRKKEDILTTSIPTRSKAHNIIKRMLASLGDPYTRFLSPEEFTKMARYDMSGIGLNLREVLEDDGGVKLKVLGLLLDGPAHSAGVRQVKHGNCGPIQSIAVQRQLVARTPVFYRLEQSENGNASVGYMRLKEFNALARKDLATAMKRLQDMGASYFVLDLRDNLGGLVQAGIEIAKLFLKEGETVIYTVGKDLQYQNTIVADAAPLVTAPVIVLVNNKTASASEIVASSLHDNCRAVLVGERTFGKGLIQSVFELHDGSGVVVTVGKYVTPNHKDINGNGIEPDYRNFPAWSDVRQHLSQCSKLQQG